MTRKQYTWKDASYCVGDLICNNCKSIMYSSVDIKIPVTYRYTDAYLIFWHMMAHWTSYKCRKELLSENFSCFSSYFWIWKSFCLQTCAIAVTRHQRKSVFTYTKRIKFSLMACVKSFMAILLVELFKWEPLFLICKGS